MSFAALGDVSVAAGVLQRSLERGRVGHAYLFAGEDLRSLEALARVLAKTLNCQNPPRRSGSGQSADCCDQCIHCRRIDAENHPDVQWVRPESKSRVITIDQVRELIQTINLKPSEAAWKVALITGADRLNAQAANAFLKTLEEPPPCSVFILLTSEPDRLLDTIRSRCLRLHSSGGARLESGVREWLALFARSAVETSGSLLARYRLLGVILDRLAQLKAEVERETEERSPLARLNDLEVRLRERLEAELAAATEAEYRRRRADLLTGIEMWLRDVWACALGLELALLQLPELRDDSAKLAIRLDPGRAAENFETIERTQRLLYTNVQEALALEVGLLRLNL